MTTAIATTNPANALDRDAENALWRKAVRAHEREGAWNIASRDDSEITADRVIIRDKTPRTMAVYEVQAKALREPKHGELTTWDRYDKPYRAACLAWEAYCEEHGHIYMQPSESDSDIILDFVDLCNSTGPLALFDVFKNTIKLPEKEDSMTTTTTNDGRIFEIEEDELVRQLFERIAAWVQATGQPGRDVLLDLAFSYEEFNGYAEEEALQLIQESLQQQSEQIQSRIKAEEGWAV